MSQETAQRANSPLVDLLFAVMRGPGHGASLTIVPETTPIHRLAFAAHPASSRYVEDLCDLRERP
jgi:hypothetical protein